MKLINLWQSAFVGIWITLAPALAYYNNGDDNAGDDGGANKYYQKQDDDDKESNYSGNDFIKYWTEYAVKPLKCIHQGGKDVIVYSMYDKYYNHCSDKALGTYKIDVPTFMAAYLEQLDLNGQDMYGDDYQTPAGTYIDCYPYETNNGVVSTNLSESIIE